MTIVKNLIIDFDGSYVVLLRHKFWLTYFDNETAALLKISEICKEMHFDSLFFLNEANITTSFLIIYLKCTVVRYASLNSSPVNKPF